MRIKPQPPTHQAQPRLDGTIRSVVRTFGLLRRVMDPYFAQFGISTSQWGVLRAIHRAESEGHAVLRLTDLGERLLVRPPSVTGVVDRLSRMGLLARSKSTEDHRVKEVRLTPAGRERIERVLEHLPAQHELVLGELNGDERQQLQRLLGVLAQRLQSLASQSEKSEEGEAAAPIAAAGTTEES
jgi:DNA-binding MarR family transcriptional regulator